MEPNEVEVVVTDGAIGDEVKDRTRSKIAHLEQYAPRDFLFAQVRFSRQDSEAQPVYAQGLLDVQGTIVQARMHAGEPEECIDLLVERLAVNLRRLSDRLQSRRQEPARVGEGQWRSGALPTERPDHYPRPREERDLVERVTHAREPSTPEEAAFDLDLLEDDWLLYVDEASDSDAVIRHLDGDGTYAVATVSGDIRVTDEGPFSIKEDPPPPELQVEQALERLEAGEEDHVFFVDPATDRGAVAYWRYDGHFGVVRPRDS